jgi:TRAP-type mannitol/chloroaromatic compound transport system substrate-binding protein
MDRRKFLRTSGLVGGAAAAAGLATPSISQQRVPMVIVSSWPRGLPGLGTGAERLAAKLEAATDGFLAVEYYAPGERVGAFDVLDAVSSGNAQAYHTADYYWKGVHPAWGYITAVPFGLTALEQNAFIHHMGGQELWDELGDEFGIKGFLAGNTGLQMGGWFNVEVNDPADFRGLRFRIPGLGGDMMAKMGCSIVSLPGGQIYENFVSGAIDAAEWVGPWNDWFLKFYEAARFYYWPGVHEPGSALSLGLNKSWFSGLPTWVQLTIEACANQENDRMLSELNARNGEYLTRLINDHGVQLRRFNEDIYDAFGDASEEVFEEARQHSDLANRMHEGFLKARTEVSGWLNVADVPYIVERNRVLGLN